jgi:hypothetical protein
VGVTDVHHVDAGREVDVRLPIDVRQGAAVPASAKTGIVEAMTRGT